MWSLPPNVLAVQRALPEFDHVLRFPGSPFLPDLVLDFGYGNGPICNF